MREAAALEATGGGQVVFAPTVLRPPFRRTLAAKTVVDLVGATVLLLLCAPLLVVIALAVRASLGPGVLYRQTRVGRGGRPFTILKFRTMRPDRRRRPTPGVQPDRRHHHKSAADPRHSPLGRVLRSTGLDELPQLWNVLRREMSLVGPRPELPEVVSRYEPWQHDRHLVRPGITGLWQVTQRGQGPMEEFTHLDLEYVASVSLWLDLSIMLRTVPALMRRRGV